MKQKLGTFVGLELKRALKKVYDSIPESTKTNLETSGVEKEVKKVCEKFEKKVNEYKKVFTEEEISHWKETLKTLSPEKAKEMKEWLQDCPLFQSKDVFELGKEINEDFVNILETRFGNRCIALTYLMGIRYACTAENKKDFIEGIFNDITTSHTEKQLIKDINSFLNS